MTYVDGFVLAVPRANIESYRKMASLGRDVWMEYGARSYVENMGDDVPEGQVTSFPKAVQATEDEVVFFSWITYGSREERDAINAKVMADPRMQGEEWKAVFDGQRMIYGGFQTFVEA